MIMTVLTWGLCATREDALGELDGNMKDLLVKSDQVDPLLLHGDWVILSAAVTFNILLSIAI